MKSSTKILIKKIIGFKTVSAAKKVLQNAKFARDSILNYRGTIKTQNKYKIYSIPNVHLFFGYYDLQQLDDRGRRLLVHALPLDAKMGKSEIEIGYFDKATEKYNKISSSCAWNWQQGCRLRWHPTDTESILFNDYVNGKYVTKMWNLVNNKLVMEYPVAFYDVDDNLKNGISVNFSRLQRLRPGYGYSNLVDDTLNDNAPVDDGVFIYNYDDCSTKLLISLHELAEQANSMEYQNYINHVSFSPNGEKFMFFHIWTKSVDDSWKTRLMICDLKGNYKCIEDSIVVSHYCWISDSKLLITSIDGEYIVYDVNNEKNRICSKNMGKDGHPSMLIETDHFISDTYPQKNDFQTLFFASLKDDYYKECARIYSDPRLFGERRCDLHPRISKDGTLITIDSTMIGRRCVIEIDL